MKERFRGTFSSLIVSTNYRRYTAGQTVSLAGSWMQTVAQGWLVLQLSNSGTMVGLVTAFQFLPVLLLAPLGGVLVDRVDTRKLLITTQALAGVLAGVLGVLVVTDTVRLWMVFAVAGLVGVVQIADNPARQTFVLQLVGPEHLTNAVTLNSVNINVARVVGPALAALVIKAVGVGSCFLLNAASFGFVIVALLALRVHDLHPRIVAPRAKGQVREGLRYVRRTPSVRTPLLMIALIGTLAYEFQVSLVLVAHQTFDGGAGTYGLLTSAMGVGAVVGGLGTAGRDRRGIAVLVRVSLLFGVLMLAAAAAPTLVTMLALLVLVGGVSITFLARANTTLQLEADPEMRGRVMALWTVAFLGSTPIGGPIIGWVGEHFGARWSIAVGGASCVLAALYGLRQLRAAAPAAGRAPAGRPHADAVSPAGAAPAAVPVAGPITGPVPAPARAMVRRGAGYGDG